MNETTTLWGFIHAIWDSVGFAVLAAICIGLVIGNFAMVLEWFSKRKQAKNDLHNINSKRHK